MATYKSCSNCGAQNDIIADHCMFCKTPLQSVKNDLLSNEDLISSTSEWIEKSRLRDLEIINNMHSGKADDASPRTVLLNNSEIRSYASKYLSILAYRTSHNPELTPVYHELSTTFAQIKPIKISFYQLGKRYQEVISVIAIWLLAIFLWWGLGTVITNENGISDERERLNDVSEEVSNLINNTEYSTALVKTEELRWTFKPEKYIDEVRQFNAQRDSLKRSIRDLINSRE